MTAYIRNPLTYVWLFLTTITLASWWFSQASGTRYQLDATVTVAVILLASVKVHFVVRYFMEVRHAPAWLKYTTNGWLWLLSALLIIFYFVEI